MRGDPKNLFIKSCAFILTFLNISHLQSTLYLVQYTYQDVFPLLRTVFWTHQFWCLLVLLSFFISPLPHGQNVSLWGIFSSRETKSPSGWDQVNREGGAWGPCPFWSKTAEHSVWCRQVHSQITHNEMGKRVQRVFKKNSLKRNTASHNNASWWTDPDGFLEHSPSRGSLYYKGPALWKIILSFGEPPLCWPYILRPC